MTFTGGESAFTPSGLTGPLGQAIIAPFFADVDTRVGPIVQYGSGTVGLRPAFGVTWPGVGCYSRISIPNWFQLVLIDRSDIAAGDFDIEFNYDQIRWETGTASGGSSSCLGGTSVRVGFSNGTGDVGTNLEFAGSGVDGAFLDGGVNGLVDNSLNSGGHLGRYLFRVRGGVPVSADLSVTKSDSPDPVNVGNNLTYTIVVTNNGPEPATGVTLTDTLPAGVTFVSASSTQGSCSEAGGTVTCTIGSMAVGGSETVTIVVTTTTAAGASISNSATAQANEPDLTSGNNTATETTTVDLNVPPVFDPPTPANATVFTVNDGSPVSFTVTASDPNVGSPASPAVLFGVSGDFGSQSETLFTIDQTNASTTLVTFLGNGDRNEEIAYNPDSGLILRAPGGKL